MDRKGSFSGEKEEVEEVKTESREVRRMNGSPMMVSTVILRPRVNNSWRDELKSRRVAGLGAEAKYERKSKLLLEF